MGLSMAHNSPSGRRTLRTWQRIEQAADTDRPRPLMTLAVGGSLLRVQGAKVPKPEQTRAPRGNITGFSAAARKRLIEMLASINRTALERLPLFVTLTYPGTWNPDPQAGNATWIHGSKGWSVSMSEQPQSGSWSFNHGALLIFIFWSLAPRGLTFGGSVEVGTKRLVLGMSVTIRPGQT